VTTLPLMANLKMTYCGVEFENPTVLASGVLGVTAASLRRVVELGAGGVTTKSIWMEEHKGHKNPTMFGTKEYFLNAVGLSDAGIEKARGLFDEYSEGGRPGPLIASVVAGKVSEFEKIAGEIVKLKPDVIEINISCPNVEDEFGVPFACEAGLAGEVVKVVRGVVGGAGSGVPPVIVKLSPNTPAIGAIASACAEAGADGFCAINTVGPGMAIDLKLRKPVLTNRVGGLSGPAIKPIAVKCVNDVWKATGLPVIGTGGVMTGEDAIEMMMAGATLVGIGTMVYYRGAEGFGEIVREMNEWCDANGVKDLSEIVGVVK
jgi:dihydroorotate dehydrogenase (NAD+) catalytic subunit